jgi:hypothetical protein
VNTFYFKNKNFGQTRSKNLPGIITYTSARKRDACRTEFCYRNSEHEHRVVYNQHTRDHADDITITMLMIILIKVMLVIIMLITIIILFLYLSTCQQRVAYNSRTLNV